MIKLGFINIKDVEITNFSYRDFDILVTQSGYALNKNGSLHQYYDWSKIDHFLLPYSKLSNNDLNDLFCKSIIYDQTIYFFVRLSHEMPLLKISGQKIVQMLEDICREVDYMGLEAISEDGKHIFEFADESSYVAYTNFKI